MLTPAYLAGCADQVAAMFSQLEADITADVATRVARMGKYSETSQWQAQKLREVKAAYDICQRMLKTCRTSANKEVQEVLLNGCREAMRADDRLYRAAGMHTYSISSSKALMDIILAGLAKTNGLMDNLTMTTARDASHSIQNALDRAYMQVMSGAYSYDQAAARVIKDLGDKGYICFKYDSGTHTSLEAATRRALLTGLNQTTAELQLHRATDLGTELVEVSSHAGARPTHAVWQGEIYSLHGDAGKYKNFYRETNYGDGDGLCGWNCYHNFYPYMEGVSQPTFEKDPARRLGKTNDELYEETQQQRYYERQIRKSRRECSTLSAAMDEADDQLRERLRPEFTKASVLLKRREAALKAFCEKTGLPYDASRVTTYSFGRSTSAKVVWANRKASSLTNGAKSGTINTGAEPVSLRFLNRTDKLAINALKIQPLNGFEDIVVHGSKTGFEFKDADGKTQTINVHEFSGMLKDSGVYHGGAIRLISCETGAEGATTAQLLANDLGVDVLAPTDVVWVLESGEMTIGPEYDDNTGEWKLFKPERK